MRASRSRLARRTASTTTSAPSNAVMVTRPEKLLSRSVPPGSSATFRVTCSVSANARPEWRPTSARAARTKAAVRIGRWTERVPLGLLRCSLEASLFVLGASLFVLEASLFVLRSTFEVQRSRVDGHADDGVDAEGVEVVDLILCGDPAGGRHAARRGAPDFEDRLHVGAAHQPFRIHMGIEELVAEGLERSDGVSGSQRKRRFPPMDDDLAAAAVDGGNDALAADRVRERFGERQVRLAVLEQRRAGDDLMRTAVEEVVGARDRPDASADAA